MFKINFNITKITFTYRRFLIAFNFKSNCNLFDTPARFAVSRRYFYETLSDVYIRETEKLLIELRVFINRNKLCVNSAAPHRLY